MVLGLKFAMLYTVISRFLKRRLVIASLPDHTRILLRRMTPDIFIIDEIYVKNVYEKHYHPKRDDVVFDVGSHIGVFTLKASRFVGTGGVVYAFEPCPGNFALLKQNISLNNASNVKILNKAISSQKGMLQFYIDHTNPAASSFQYAGAGVRPIALPCITLDHVLQERDIQQVNLLKLDVEGHEIEVLRGARHFLGICEQIAMETHQRAGGPSNAQIVEELRKYGFRTELVRYSLLPCENDMLYAWRELKQSHQNF